MPFDLGRFQRDKFAHRQRVVEVETMAAYFTEGEKPEWTVRGLSASELHRALEASKHHKDIVTFAKAIATGGGDQVQALRQTLGLTSDTPGEIASRMEMLVMGSVLPKIELPDAVKIAHSFAIEFLALTNAIKELTGEGSDLVKPAAASQLTTA